ncbi:unnamed protein product [Amoebophrya sp. A120]|nr:unnamed protein product [Amoebophrya sp. A120]|eukprot:GSA120T00022517001.1
MACCGCFRGGAAKKSQQEVEEENQWKEQLFYELQQSTENARESQKQLQQVANEVQALSQRVSSGGGSQGAGENHGGVDDLFSGRPTGHGDGGQLSSSSAPGGTTTRLAADSVAEARLEDMLGELLKRLSSSKGRSRVSDGDRATKRSKAGTTTSGPSKEDVVGNKQDGNDDAVEIIDETSLSKASSSSTSSSATDDKKGLKQAGSLQNAGDNIKKEKKIKTVQQRVKALFSAAGRLKKGTQDKRKSAVQAEIERGKVKENVGKFEDKIVGAAAKKKGDGKVGTSTTVVPTASTITPRTQVEKAEEADDDVEASGGALAELAEVDTKTAVPVGPKGKVREHIGLFQDKIAEQQLSPRGDPIEKRSSPRKNIKPKPFLSRQSATIVDVQSKNLSHAPLVDELQRLLKRRQEKMTREKLRLSSVDIKGDEAVSTTIEVKSRDYGTRHSSQRHSSAVVCDVSFGQGQFDIEPDQEMYRRIIAAGGAAHGTSKHVPIHLHLPHSSHKQVEKKSVEQEPVEDVTLSSDEKLPSVRKTASAVVASGVVPETVAGAQKEVVKQMRNTLERGSPRAGGAPGAAIISSTPQEDSISPRSPDTHLPVSARQAPHEKPAATLSPRVVVRNKKDGFLSPRDFVDAKVITTARTSTSPRSATSAETPKTNIETTESSPAESSTDSDVVLDLTTGMGQIDAVQQEHFYDVDDDDLNCDIDATKSRPKFLPELGDKLRASSVVSIESPRVSMVLGEVVLPGGRAEDDPPAAEVFEGTPRTMSLDLDLFTTKSDIIQAARKNQTLATAGRYGGIKPPVSALSSPKRPGGLTSTTPRTTGAAAPGRGVVAGIKLRLTKQPKVAAGMKQPNTGVEVFSVSEQERRLQAVPKSGKSVREMAASLADRMRMSDEVNSVSSTGSTHQPKTTATQIKPAGSKAKPFISPKRPSAVSTRKPSTAKVTAAPVKPPPVVQAIDADKEQADEILSLQAPESSIDTQSELAGPPADNYSASVFAKRPKHQAPAPEKAIREEVDKDNKSGSTSSGSETIAMAQLAEKLTKEDENRFDVDFHVEHDVATLSTTRLPLAAGRAGQDADNASSASSVGEKLRKLLHQGAEDLPEGGTTEEDIGSDAEVQSVQVDLDPDYDQHEEALAPRGKQAMETTRRSSTTGRSRRSEQENKRGKKSTREGTSSGPAPAQPPNHEMVLQMNLDAFALRSSMATTHVGITTDDATSEGNGMETPPESARGEVDFFSPRAGDGGFLFGPDLLSDIVDRKTLEQIEHGHRPRTRN